MNGIERLENVCHYESFILTMKSTLLAKTIAEKGYGLLAEKILFLNQKRLKDRCHAEMASITAQVKFITLNAIYCNFQSKNFSIIDAIYLRFVASHRSCMAKRGEKCRIV